MALGCDYPTAHMIISESTPSANRGKLVLGAFAFQALGALGGTGNRLYRARNAIPRLERGAGCMPRCSIPALIVTVGRFFITESPSWLVVRGAHEEAEKAATRLLKRVPQYPKDIRLGRLAGADEQVPAGSFLALFDIATFARRSWLRCPGLSRT